MHRPTLAGTQRRTGRTRSASPCGRRWPSLKNRLAGHRTSRDGPHCTANGYSGLHWRSWTNRRLIYRPWPGLRNDHTRRWRLRSSRTLHNWGRRRCGSRNHRGRCRCWNLCCGRRRYHGPCRRCGNWSPGNRRRRCRSRRHNRNRPVRDGRRYDQARCGHRGHRLSSHRRRRRHTCRFHHWRRYCRFFYRSRCDGTRR
jgi:hypothetical protein